MATVSYKRHYESTKEKSICDWRSASRNTSYYNANNNLGVAHLSSSKEPPEHQHVYLVCPRGLGGGWSPRPYLRSSDRGVHQEL